MSVHTQYISIQLLELKITDSVLTSNSYHKIISRLSIQNELIHGASQLASVYSVV